MRGALGLVVLLLLFASCQREEKVIYLRFDNSEGLQEKNHVLLNGVKVGEVLSVDITKDYLVLATVRLSDSLDFPKDTRFEIQSQDLFTKMIFVTPGDSKSFLENGDTIPGVSSIDLRDQIPCSNPPPKIIDDLKEMLRN